MSSSWELLWQKGTYWCSETGEKEILRYVWWSWLVWIYIILPEICEIQKVLLFLDFKTGTNLLEKPGLHLSQLGKSFGCQTEPKNYRMNLQHFLFNTILLPLQGKKASMTTQTKKWFYLENIFTFSFLLPKRENLSQKRHKHKVSYSPTNIYTYIIDIYIYWHAYTWFLDGNCSYLNIWQSRRQIHIQKK